MILQQQRKEDRESDRRRWIYPLISVFVSLFVAVGLSISYTHSVVRKNEQNWCEIVTSLNDQYQKTPPTTPVGIAFAEQIHRLLKKLNCS